MISGGISLGFVKLFYRWMDYLLGKNTVQMKGDYVR